ncbi:gypsy retrotransposon integrase-like protein 1 isoform X3 [Pipistrellus kuhlii]|uniref:gypsy retrotransposon integrase-like protein 1 isoform X3 n=1 Tax=Pipistrellus kuhlii TaxID=59472 RepID=UPI00174F47B9|nr:gypsy retrotransposon integrase-like protein 1 isoform X3 [Pipistrellus kuhlii]
MVRSGKNGELHLKQIAYYKRTGEYHPTTLPSERSGIRRAAKKFVFKDKKLFYVGKDRKQNRLVIISEEEKKKVLRECHENNTGAHHGISRTLTLVESNYYWTSVTNDVKQWVYACHHCQVAKNTVILAPKQHLKVENPWSIVTVDLMGPFHISNRRHVYTIIMTDLFTKWVVILPLCDVSASEVSKAIINIFFLYGPPQKIIMDQRDEFIHQINVELYGMFGMKQIVISHASQAVNQTEGIPKTIKTFLSKHCADYPHNWDDHLSAVSFAFNVTHLEPTKNMPYFQMFNRNPYMPETSDVLHEVDGDDTNSLYLLQSSVVADHDYIGLPEITVGAYQASILVEDATIGVADNELLTSSKDGELLEYRNTKISPLIEDNSNLEKQTFSLLDSSSQVLEYLS